MSVMPAWHLDCVNNYIDGWMLTWSLTQSLFLFKLHFYLSINGNMFTFLAMLPCLSVFPSLSFFRLFIKRRNISHWEHQYLSTPIIYMQAPATRSRCQNSLCHSGLAWSLLFFDLWSPIDLMTDHPEMGSADLSEVNSQRLF